MWFSKSWRSGESVSATNLAKMLVCENQIVLARRLGKRSNTREQQRRADAGNRMHDAIHKAEIRHSRAGGVGPVSLQGRKSVDSRCFIATAVFGMDAPETWRLRRFRDEQLMKSGAGRAFVRIYYAISPPVADWLGRHGGAAAFVRVALGFFISVIQYTSRKK